MRDNVVIITSVITRGAATIALKLTQIGNSFGIVLPKAAQAELNVAKGDRSI